VEPGTVLIVMGAPEAVERLRRTYGGVDTADDLKAMGNAPAQGRA